MQKQVLVATRAMRYDGRDVGAGERFAAAPVDAPYLVRSKRAREAPADPTTVATTVTPQDSRGPARSQHRGPSQGSRRAPGYYSSRTQATVPGAELED